jgi:hypothetical protein
VPEIVVRLRAAVELKFLPVAVDALKLDKTGDDVRLEINRAEARRADEAGRSRAYAFDGLGTKRGFFDVHSGSEIFRHDSSFRAVNPPG